MLAPSKTPKEMVAKLNADMVKVLRLKEINDKLIDLGFQPVANTPAEFEQFIRAEITKWARVIKDAHVHLD